MTKIKLNSFLDRSSRSGAYSFNDDEDKFTTKAAAMQVNYRFKLKLQKFVKI